MTLHRLIFAVAFGVLAGCTTMGDPALITSSEKPTGHEERRIEQLATVTGVDQQRRLLALKSDDGATAVLPIASEFRDFDKVRVGDVVVVSLTEAIAWEVKPATMAATGVSARESLTNPRSGQAPGGALEHAITVTATITALDPDQGTVTLTGPQGVVQSVKARNPSDVGRVRVGDLVEITYSEVRALAVRSAEHR